MPRLTKLAYAAVIALACCAALHAQPNPPRTEIGAVLRSAKQTPFVTRRTHSSLMNATGANPKLIADQQGHGVDVNLNVYTQSSFADRLEAVETLETAFVN